MTFHVDYLQDSVIARFDPPLIKGVLLKRYKRFLADVRLDDGREVTAHCMNTGSMRGLVEPGSEVWLTPHNDPKRKLQWTWQIASCGGHLVGINTSLPNALVSHAIQHDVIEGLRGYKTHRTEVRYGEERSRIDVHLSEHPDDERVAFVEVKSVTLVSDGVAMFPDAVSARGLKHLRELMRVVKQGDRAVMLYVVQRADGDAFAPAAHIDPDYARGVIEAQRAGVECIALRADVSPHGVGLSDTRLQWT